MTKFYDLKKSDFEYSLYDETIEFNEYVDFIFITKNTLYVTLSNKLTDAEIKNVQSHITSYYVDRGYNKINYLLNVNNEN